MKIDAVEVIPRLFRRDRKPRLVDQLREVFRRQREFVRQRARGQCRKILARQRLQLKARASRRQRQPSVALAIFQQHLRAIRQLAHDVVKRVGGGRRRPAAHDVGAYGLHHFDIEIRRRQRQRSLLGMQQHIGQDRDRIAPLDDALHMVQRFEKACPFDGDAHPKSKGSRRGERRKRRAAWRGRKARGVSEAI